MTRNNPQTAPEKNDFRMGCQRSTGLSQLQTPTQARRVPYSGYHGEGKCAFENRIVQHKVALHVDDDERSGLRVEVQSKRFCLNGCNGLGPLGWG